MTDRMPTLFVSHGAPTWALEPGRAGARLAELGRRLPRPKAIVVVSPHWTTREVSITGASQPETIHDFGGFPAELYRLRYPAPGMPALAARIRELLGAAGYRASIDEQRGLDHGAWVPLMHLYPQADLPVLQVSMPATLDSDSAWRLGEALAPLADEGVLIVGSGSLTHNLHEFRGPRGDDEPYVAEFAEWVREAAAALDRGRLVRTLSDAPHARRAHPTAEHFLPLLVAAGAARPGTSVEVLDGGIAYGILSMESYLFDAPAPLQPSAVAQPAPPARAVIVQQPAGRAAQLILLFHGVGGTAGDMTPLARRLASAFPQALVVSVGAPDECASGAGLQWFPVQGITDENRAQRVDAAMPAFVATIRHWQEISGVGVEGTAVIGFSQGAIMALECTREREALAGRIAAIAGRFARLPERAAEGTTLYLLHGKADPVIPYAHTVAAAERIVSLGGDVVADVIPFVGHGIDDEVSELLVERLKTYLPKRHWEAAMRAAAQEQARKG